MRILINHLTRMQKGCFCAAGIDLDSGRHVRPVLNRQLPTELLACHGGAFDLGRVIEMGEARFFGRVPHVEDHLFELADLRVVDAFSPEHFWRRLLTVAKDNLSAIFGPDLELFGNRTFVVAESCGLRSLGCYWARGARLATETRGEAARLRFSFECLDPVSGRAIELRVPITDIRLFQSDHLTPDLQRMAEIDYRLSKREKTLICVGLTRPYKLSSEGPARHWLQVNNIHFEDAPLWERPWD